MGWCPTFAGGEGGTKKGGRETIKKDATRLREGREKINIRFFVTGAGGIQELA